MKKIVLGSTLIASLLLAGGVNAFANTIPASEEIQIDIVYGDATFEFNGISLAAPVISESIFEGPVEGTINVGGTLTNLTASQVSVNFDVKAPDDFDGIVVDANNLESLTAAPVDTDSIPEGTEITFTIDREFAQEFAKLEEGDEKPVITITAQEGNSNNGDNLSL
ncbi:hypothetical protein [Enterococcus sp. OL5]|uniref:hypothetical protein n=1 Tax=Enterococcus sp. OL5 TaxID=2590214 RepID=UPI00112AA6D2|nr:hypothetical protein [Enterococcus sp. OL5]TPR59389.1 hypothetical protein FJU10_00695 [Enterococcus sp. OL5]